MAATQSIACSGTECALVSHYLSGKNMRLNATSGLAGYHNGEADTDTVQSYYLQVNLPRVVIDCRSSEPKTFQRYS